MKKTKRPAVREIYELQPGVPTAYFEMTDPDDYDSEALARALVAKLRQTFGPNGPETKHKRVQVVLEMHHTKRRGPGRPKRSAIPITVRHVGVA